MDNIKPLISVIVPVKNNENTIKEGVESILNLNYQNFELIIVNDGSTDSTKNILEELTDDRKIVIETTGVGASKSRNLAVEKAKGEFVAFTDGDCIVDGE